MSKPLYRIPTMADIAALPWNGFTVASTFSGCGGSSLGYRMAGYRVAYANEFVPAARESYLANCSPATVVDGRDIRKVQPSEILDACKVGVGELDLLDSSPPCSSFSLAGARASGWGKAKKYSDTVQRTDDLFFQFARLLDAIRPKTFVAENVAGLVRGVAKGYFLEILKALKGCGYKVVARVLDASWLGVPQARHRLIFIGVRDDLAIEPVHPNPLAYSYTIREALPWISDKSLIQPPVEPEADITKFAIGREWDKMGRPGTQSEKYFQLVRPRLDRPCPTITAEAGNSGAAGVTHPTERRKFSIAELKLLSGFPADFKLTGTYRQQWERIGRAVPPVMMSHIARAIAEGVLCKL